MNIYIFFGEKTLKNKKTPKKVPEIKNIDTFNFKMSVPQNHNKPYRQIAKQKGKY